LTHASPTPPTPEDAMRTHVVVPEDLLAEVDRLIGPRRRSQFFVDAVAEKVARIKLADVAAKAAGALKEVSIPDWNTAEKARNWVRGSRQADEQRMQHKRDV
jgi:hypothetical protein